MAVRKNALKKKQYKRQWKCEVRILTMAKEDMTAKTVVMILWGLHAVYILPQEGHPCSAHVRWRHTLWLVPLLFSKGPTCLNILNILKPASYEFNTCVNEYLYDVTNLVGLLKLYRQFFERIQTARVEVCSSWSCFPPACHIVWVLKLIYIIKKCTHFLCSFSNMPVNLTRCITN